MKTSAPGGPGSSPSISTDKSTANPLQSLPRPSAPESNSQTHRHEGPRKKPERQFDGAKSVANISSRPSESSPWSSRRANPQAKAHQSGLESLYGFSTASRLPQTVIPSIRIQSPTPEDAPLSSWQTVTLTDVDSPYHREQLVSSDFPSTPQPSGSKAEVTIPQSPEGRILRPHELMSGGRSMPIYGPFTSPNCPQGYRPQLKRDPDYLNLRDCWACSERKVSTWVLRREQGLPVENYNYPLMLGAVADKSTLDKPVIEKDHGQASGGPASEVAACEMVQSHNIDTQAPLPSQEITEDADSDTTRSPAESGMMSRAAKGVAFPFTAAYQYVSSGVRNYIHDRNARAGELGSHNTETAYWLQHAMLESPESLKNQDYHAISVPHFVERERW